MTNKGRIVTATHTLATAPNGILGGRMVSTAAAFAGTTKTAPGVLDTPTGSLTTKTDWSL